MVLIADRPNRNFHVSIFGYPMEFRVSLSDSVIKALAPRERLTNEVALRVFRQIAVSSKIKALMTHRIVTISLGTALILAGSFIPMEPLLLDIIGFLVCFIGGFILGFSIGDDFLPQLSQAYRDQAEEASLLIGQLALAEEELAFEFA